MVHTIQWRVGSDEALDFWAARLADADVASERTEEGALAFADFEGLRHELLAVAVDDAPLAARAPDIPPEHALLGFHGVRAYASRPDASTDLLEAIGFAHDRGADWKLRGDERQAALRYDAPPERRGVTSAGTVHHVAWSAADDAELEAVRAQAVGAGARATEIIDRQYFHSVYFREPSGVLFELASRDIGFEYDEPLESLGEALKLPPQYESRRAELEQALTPLSNPRAGTTA
jgi:glyoxalase family protein